MKQEHSAQVLIPIHVNKVFDYRIPEGMPLQPGMRVVVNFCGRRIIGIVKSIGTPSIALERLKSIQQTLDSAPFISPAAFALSLFMSRQYYVSEADALKLFLPAFLNKKGITFPQSAASESRENLSGSLITWIAEEKNNAERFGVYAQRIRETIDAGQSCLLCVPVKEELEAMQKRFNQFSSCLYSSSLKEPHARKSWIEFKSGVVPLCVGTRGAFFILPERLGLIIVDDCLHDAYSHPESPFYTLVDLVSVYARLKKIPVLLHSKYPSVRLFSFAQRKHIGVRAFGQERTPEVRIVEEHRAFLKKGHFISPFVSDTIVKALSANERIMLLYNKKGFSAYLRCSACKEIIMCERCSIPLKYYFSQSLLRCPLCHYSVPYDNRCTRCGKGYIQTRGTGIERLQSLLGRFFPDARTVPLDQARAQPISSGQIITATVPMITEITEAFAVEHMIVLDIDAQFYRPDYDSSLKVFRILQHCKNITTRRLIVISAFASHYAVQSLLHEHAWFYEQEIKARKEYHLPPYYKTVKITLRSFSEKSVEKKAGQLKAILDAVQQKQQGAVTVLGPNKELPFKLRDQYYYSIILSAKNRKVLYNCIQAARAGLSLGPVKMAIIPKYD